VNSFLGFYSDIQNFRPRMIVLRDPYTDSIIAANRDEDISVAPGHNIFVMKYLGC
jgi:hypothetical protein